MLFTMSAVFFYFFGLVMPNIIAMWLEEITAHTGFGTTLIILAPAFLALISLAGCTIFIRNSRTANRHWYLGIPLWIVMAVATVSLFISPFSLGTGGEPLFTDPGYLTNIAMTAALFLLAPCSALFFWSLREITDRITVPVIIALGISIVSAILLYGLLFPQTYAPGEHIGMSVYEPFFWLYVMLGLPVVGAIYVALGLKYPPPPEDDDIDVTPQ